MNQNHPKPKNYLIEAILSTIFCCQITGIVSIVYAAQVNSLYAEGKFDAADRAAKNAKNWFMVGLIIGIILYILSFAFGFFGVLASLGGFN